jgi:hypothetical protein
MVMFRFIGLVVACLVQRVKCYHAAHVVSLIFLELISHFVVGRLYWPCHLLGGAYIRKQKLRPLA